MSLSSRFWDFSQKPNIKTEILAGFTVAMTMIPESLSFAIIAGLPPLTGLYAAFIMGIFTAIFGGRPGMISGGAGATIIVMLALIKMHGIEYLFAAVILAGIIQILVGIFKFGKFIKLLPVPVMYGFVNGLAVFIFLSQLEQFKVEGEWLTGTALWIMAGLVVATIIIVYLFPKITKKFPPSLMAILIVFALVFSFDIPTKTIGDIAQISGGFPPFHIPNIPFTMDTFWIVLPFAGLMAGVGLLESLLTLSLVDDITQTKGQKNREIIAQGGANIINGFFTGMGGCAMIAQTFVNLNSGAKTRLSGILAALIILAIILWGAPIIEQVPIAALVGIMIMVAIATFKWSSLRIVNKMPKADIFIGILVALLTIIYHNLALAVLVGVVLSALVFSWNSSGQLCISKSIVVHTVQYTVMGPLFFGSSSTFIEQFDYHSDLEYVTIDMEKCIVLDMSGLDALQIVQDKYQILGKKITFLNIQAGSMQILEKSKITININ